MITKKCDVCNETFSPEQNTQLRCSKKCVKKKNNETSRLHYAMLRKSELKDKVCLHCKTTFSPVNHTQIYCCYDCRCEARRIFLAKGKDKLSPRQVTMLSVRQKMLQNESIAEMREKLRADVQNAKNDVERAMQRLSLSKKQSIYVSPKQ